jgi:hypothetical protein
VLGAGELDVNVRAHAEAIRKFAYRRGNACRTIIASRPYRGPSRMGWPRFGTLKLGPAKHRELIGRWFEDRGSASAVHTELMQ